MQACAHNQSFRITHDGFSIVQDDTWRGFLTADVRSIRVFTERKCDLLSDTVIVESLQLRVVTKQGEESLSLTAEMGPFDADRLQPLREQLLENLSNRAWEQLQDGGEAEAADWSLSLIYFSDRRTDTSCFPQQIERFEWVGDNLVLWHEDLEEPFAQFPRDSENCLVLARLLPLIVAEPGQPIPPTTAVGLGAELARLTRIEPLGYRPRHMLTIASLVAATLGPAACGWISPVIALIVLLTLLIVILPKPRGARESLVHYEDGVIWSDGTREQLLLLDQIEVMTVAWRSADKQGGTESGAGTESVHLHFQRGARHSDSITFHTGVTPANRRAIQSLQCRVAAAIAQQFQQRFAQEGQLVWTPEWTITPDALLQRKGLGRDVERIAWTQVDSWCLYDQQLVIRLRAPGRVLTQATDYPNFLSCLIFAEMHGMLVPQRRKPEARGC